MHFNFPPSAVANLLHEMQSKLHYARNLGTAAGVSDALFKSYEEVESELLLLKSELEAKAVEMNYTNALATSLNKLNGQFSFNYGNDDRKPIVLEGPEEQSRFKEQQERNHSEIRSALLAFRKMRDFFSKIDFLNKDLLIVGANGSGKTFLANSLLKHARDNGVVIAARKTLHLPQFDNVQRHSIAEEALKSIQIAEKSNRVQGSDSPGEEFADLIQYLLADNGVSLKEYNRRASENAKKGIPIEPPDPTKLQKALQIWNALFTYSELYTADEMNLVVRSTNQPYAANAMSDGEKVALFLIAHVLACPVNGFVIVDEPEVYLHPNIHKRLWDKLELERSDATFIYLTHDLDFAVSRVKAKKLWLKAFKHPSEFELEEIASDDLPQSLLLELLGTRQNVLFCEGDAGSLDERIFKILFPEFLVRPVGGCLSVINYTKAFNRLPWSTTNAIGIVDGDFLSDKRQVSLQSDNVFCLEVPDVENLLLDDEVLIEFCKAFLTPEDYLKIKMEIIEALKRERDLQVAKYVSSRVEHHFKDNNLAAGSRIEELKANFSQFLKSIDIDSWAGERQVAIQYAVDQANYEAAIKVFKNKGLRAIIESKFKIKDYVEKAISLLLNNTKLQSRLRKYVRGIEVASHL